MSTREKIIEEKYRFITNSVETFGLNVDYDQLNEKGWIRINSLSDNHKPLIIFDDWEKEIILQELRNYLYSLGAQRFRLELKSLINNG